jgi:hypothetical protein
MISAVVELLNNGDSGKIPGGARTLGALADHGMFMHPFSQLLRVC